MDDAEFERQLEEEQKRQQLVTEAYEKGEIPRNEYLCLMVNDCSKCPHCYMDNE